MYVNTKYIRIYFHLIIEIYVDFVEHQVYLCYIETVKRCDYDLQLVNI